jgi:hypothetical protein
MSVVATPRLLERERIGVLGRRAACGVTRRGLEQHRAVARDGGALKARLNRATRDGLVREQIRGAHQHADLGAARGERRTHRRDHRAAARVVDAAGKQHRQLLRMLERDQLVELCLP